MLTILLHQIRAFKDNASRMYVDEMSAHARRFAPAWCTDLDTTSLQSAVTAAMTRAEGYGLTRRGSVRLFLEASLLLGASFDSDPQYRWARRILADPADEMSRADRLYREILVWLAAVPDERTTHGIIAILQRLQGAPLVIHGEATAGVRQMLASECPEKAAHIGHDGLLTLTNQADAEAYRLGLPAVRGGALLAALMFVFGHGCLADPFLPWLGRTLAAPSSRDRADIVARVAAAAVDRLRLAASDDVSREGPST